MAEISMLSATSAVEAMALPLADMLDLYAEISNIVDEIKETREG